MTGSTAAEYRRLAQDVSRAFKRDSAACAHLERPFRTSVIEGVSRALVDPVLLEEYCSALVEERKRVDAPERFAEGQAEAEWPIERIVLNGLDSISDDDLVRVAADPYGLKQLAEIIHEFMLDDKAGEAWWEQTMRAASDSAGNVGSTDTQTVMERLRQASPDDVFISEARPPARPVERPKMGWSRARSTIGLWAAAAALLVTGGLIDRFLLWDGGRPNGVSLLIAEASTPFVPTRGGEEVPHLQITSPLSGFATIVSLAPQRRPIVLPQLGEPDISVSAGVVSEPQALPEDTTRVVFVVTETPSGEIVRRIESTTLRALGLGDEDRIRDQVRMHLEKKGYRRMAFGEAPVERSPD